MIDNQNQIKSCRTAGLWMVLVAIHCLMPSAFAEKVITLAVLPFHTDESLEAEFGAQAAAIISASLSAEPGVWTVERAELDHLLAEQELGLSGTVSTETAAQVGHLTGAQVLITGRAFRAGKEVLLVSKIISTETGRVYGEMVKGAADQTVSDLSLAMVEKISTTIAAKKDWLTVEVPSLDERLRAFKATLSDDTKPSVFVDVTEEHFGAPVIDPAAETEMVRWLTECGFTVLGKNALTQPAFSITGEAFSAFGMRRGNLVSCRGRVEVKVTAAEDARIIHSISRTTAAVDITEQTAAKTALEKSSATVVQEVIQQILDFTKESQ